MKLTTLCYIEKDGRTLMLHRVKKKNDINHDKCRNEKPQEKYGSNCHYPPMHPCHLTSLKKQ